MKSTQIRTNNLCILCIQSSLYSKEVSQHHLYLAETQGKWEVFRCAVIGGCWPGARGGLTSSRASYEVVWRAYLAFSG